MGSSMSQKVEEILQKKQQRQSERESQKERREVEIQAHMEALQQIKQNLTNKPVNELPKRMRFKAAHQVSQYYDKSEKKQYYDLKNEYFKTTYAITALSLMAAFLLPLPFKRVNQFKPYQRFLLWVTIFGITHYAGMYEIKYRVNSFQLQMIEKYKNNLIGVQQQ